MSQNLCLICCYSFQEKRTRFISDEARESFRKFCGELDISLKEPKKDRSSSTSSSSSLDLPFGDNITVCGDCLSLIVLYVQKKGIQKGKEEKLLELQRAVCALLKELKEVLKDVECHINALHTTVRMGDESSIGSFYKESTTSSGQEDFEEKRDHPLIFRSKVLNLTVGPSIKPLNDFIPDLQSVPINVKVEPWDPNSTASDGDGDHFDDSYFPGASFFEDNNDDSQDSNEDQKPEVPIKEPRSSKRLRRKVVKSEYDEDFSPSLPDEKVDNDDGDHFMESLLATETRKSKDDDNDSDYNIHRRGRKKGKKRRRRPKVRKEAFKKFALGSSLKELEEAHKVAGARWKDELISRIVMQMNSDINNDNSVRPTLPVVEGGSQEVTQEINDSRVEESQEVTSNSFQFIDGELKFRSVTVKVLEKEQTLLCTRCGKKYNEWRDVNEANGNVPIENLMKEHVLKHIERKRQPPKETVEVIPFTCSTRSKDTYKIACPLKYTYTRRAVAKNGIHYFRCDNRLENCSATIAFRDGYYMRMKLGWNEDYTHQIHAPDVERTTRQLEMGKAKEMFLKENKPLEEVCKDLLQESNGELKTPLQRLKERLLYAKYRSKGIPRRPITVYRCPHCGLVYQRNRSLKHHVQNKHEKPPAPVEEKKKVKKSNPPVPDEEEKKVKKSNPPAPVPVEEKKKVKKSKPSAPAPIKEAKKVKKSNPPAPKSKSSAPKKAKKPKAKPTPKVEPDQTLKSIPAPPSVQVPSEGPSIIFNDPSVASNFVSKCMNAIMQQVGLAVPGTSSNPIVKSIPIPIPGGVQQENIVSSVSPAPSDASSQIETVPNNPQTISNPSRHMGASFGTMPPSSHWQQQHPISSQPTTAGGQPQPQYPHGSHNPQMHSWPWNSH